MLTVPPQQTLLSLVTALTIFSATFTGSQPSPWVGVLSAAGNAVVSYAARVHIHGYWRGKAKVPLVGNYNESIDKTNDLRKALLWLSLGWLAEATSRTIAMMY